MGNIVRRIEIGPSIVTRNAGDALEVEHALRGHLAPLVKALMADTEAGGELGDATDPKRAALDDFDCHAPYVGDAYLPVKHHVGGPNVGRPYNPQMMELHERIRAARQAKGLTQREVAEHFGIQRVSVTQWETGISKPDGNKFPALAALFGVNLGWLMANEGEGPKIKGGDVSRKTIPGKDLIGEQDFPIFAATQGGKGHLIVSTEPIQIVRRPIVLDRVRNAYGLLIVGESMVPAFRPGDIALIHPHLPPERDTDIILYDHDPFTGEAEAIIKHLISWTERQWRLEEYNPHRIFTEHRADWPICHRVVGKYDRRR